MNHAGFNIHARNGATRRFGANTRSELEEPQPTLCPFCGAATTVHWNRIAEHLEHLGFTRCPGSGISPELAAKRVASMTPDYKLASEGLFDE